MNRVILVTVLFMLIGCQEFEKKQNLTSDCRETEAIDSRGAVFFLDKALYFNNWRKRTIRIYKGPQVVDQFFPQYINKISNSQFFFARIKLRLKGRVIFCPADNITNTYLIVEKMIFLRDEDVKEITPDKFDIKEGIDLDED